MQRSVMLPYMPNDVALGRKSRYATLFGPLHMRVLPLTYNATLLAVECNTEKVLQYTYNATPPIYKGNITPC